MEVRSIKKENSIGGGLYILPIPRETFEKLNKFAIKRKVNFSQFVFEAIEEFLQNHKELENESI